MRLACTLLPPNFYCIFYKRNFVAILQESCVELLFGAVEFQSTCYCELARSTHVPVSWALLGAALQGAARSYGYRIGEEQHSDDTNLEPARTEVDCSSKGY